MPGFSPLGPAILISTTLVNEQYEPAVIKLAGGGQVVAWVDFTTLQIRYSVFNTQGGAVVQDLQANTLAGDKRSPDLLPLPDGGFILSWVSFGTEGYFQRFDGLGRKVGGERLVTNEVSTPNLKIGALPDGGWIFGWQSSSTSDGSIGAKRYDSNGNALDDPFTIDPNNPGGENFPGIGFAPDGFAVSWLSEGNGGQAFLQRFNGNAEPVGDKVLIGPTSLTGDFGPVIEGSPDGTQAIVHVRPGTNGGPDQLVLVTVTLDGLADEVVVADLANGLLGSASLARLPSGLFVVSWIQNNPAGADPMLARAFDASNLAPVGDLFTVTDSARFKISESIAPLPADRVIFTWDGAGSGDGQGVFSRTFQLTDFGNVATPGADELTGTGAGDSLDGLGGDDAIFGQGGNDTLVGNDGNDRLFGGDGDDAMSGGAGNDFGLIQQLLDSFVGGDGIDTAGVQGNFIGTLAVDPTTETLLVASGNDTRFGDYSGSLYDYNLVMAAQNRPLLNVIATGLLVGEDLVFDGSALAGGGLRVFGGAGLVTVNGGSGNDGSLFGVPEAYNPLNVFNGGDGIDTLAFRGNHVGAKAIVLNDASIVAVDLISLLSGRTNQFGGFIDMNGFDYELTIANGNVAPGGTLEINANGLFANESVRVDASAELDGLIRFFLGAGDDDVVGSAGADLIFGNLGADEIDGGPGGDTHSYRSVLDSTPTSRDQIVLGAGDMIDLSFIDAVVATPGVNDPFVFIGAAAFGNVAGQLRVAGGLIEGDVNGDGLADLQIGFTGAPPVAADFVL